MIKMRLGLYQWKKESLHQLSQALKTEIRFFNERLKNYMLYHDIIEDSQPLPPLDKLPDWARKAKGRIDMYKDFDRYLSLLSDINQPRTGTMNKLVEYVKTGIKKTEQVPESAYKNGALEALTEIKKSLEVIEKKYKVRKQGKK